MHNWHKCHVIISCFRSNYFQIHTFGVALIMLMLSWKHTYCCKLKKSSRQRLLFPHRLFWNTVDKITSISKWHDPSLYSSEDSARFTATRCCASDFFFNLGGWQTLVQISLTFYEKIKVVKFQNMFV